MAAFLNPGNATYWTTDLERFEPVKGKPGEPGSRAMLYYRQKGKLHIMEDELLYADPGKKYVSKVSGPYLQAEVESIFEPAKSGTHIKLIWKGRGKILFLKLLLPIIKNKIKNIASKDSNTFKRLVESRGSDFSKEREPL